MDNVLSIRKEKSNIHYLKLEIMKIRSYLLALLMVCCSITATVQASETKTKELTEQRVSEIKQRVEQIKGMDLSNLSRAERKDLKHELRDMKTELNSRPAYVYISAGALILIIILLIILL